MKRVQATTMAEIEAFDEDDLIEGYRDGFAGEPEPGDNRSDAYWHGWTKGALDKGHRESTAADALLAADYVRTLRNNRSLVDGAGK